MLNTVIQVLPLPIIISLGFLLKQLRLLKEEDGSTLLIIIFYTGIKWIDPLISLLIMAVRALRRLTGTAKLLHLARAAVRTGDEH